MVKNTHIKQGIILLTIIDYNQNKKNTNMYVYNNMFEQEMQAILASTIILILFVSFGFLTDIKHRSEWINYKYFKSTKKENCQQTKYNIKEKIQPSILVSIIILYDYHFSHFMRICYVSSFKIITFVLFLNIFFLSQFLFKR